jgi:hypothetical protein
MDHSTDPPTRVFESGAILLYLAEKFGALLPTEHRKRTECLSWLFWQMGSAPYLGGGFGHFYAYAPVKIEYCDRPLRDGGEAPARRARPPPRRAPLHGGRRVHHRRHRDLALVRRARRRAGLRRGGVPLRPRATPTSSAGPTRSPSAPRSSAGAWSTAASASPRASSASATTRATSRRRRRTSSPASCRGGSARRSIRSIRAPSPTRTATASATSAASSGARLPARLGVETLWLSPFFDSPQADFGYDISDHFGIAPEYGSLDDCHALIEEVHAARDEGRLRHGAQPHVQRAPVVRRVAELEAQSPSATTTSGATGAAARRREPPNNWRSMLGRRGWHYDARREQWYWASFLPFQPDLNYRNPEVKEAMLDVVRHWLSEGVDGLRLDIFNALFKDASFANNPFSFRPFRARTTPTGSSSRPATPSITPTPSPSPASCARSSTPPGPPRFLVGEVFGDARHPPPLLRRGRRRAAPRLPLQVHARPFSGPGVRA